MKSLLTTMGLILFILCNNTQAQDKIVKTNSDTIYCKVKEILSDEIKYLRPEISGDVLFGIDKNDVLKVIFENGKTLYFEHSLYGAGNYENQKKNAVKTEFLAPLTGNTTVSFERLIKPTKSWEATVGIIGLGLDPDDDNARGAFVKIGLKYIKSPDFYLKGMRYAHILKGAYFKPEIAVSYYRYDHNEWDTWIYSDHYTKPSRESNLALALNLNIGKQWVINDAFLIDWYFGLGYGISDDNSHSAYHYGFIGADEDFPITINGGLKIGFLIK